MNDRTKYLLIGIVFGAFFSSAIVYFTVGNYQGQTAQYWYNQGKTDATFHTAYDSLIVCLAHVPIYTETNNREKLHNVNDLRDVAFCVSKSAEQ
ncbi:MAG TPA: hypothetical protein VND99_03675 [Candidatus Acidoferrales bacterium]|nr:hypothetical protein [Candidatus Acidoferrales bacterium]